MPTLKYVFGSKNKLPQKPTQSVLVHVVIFISVMLLLSWVFLRTISKESEKTKVFIPDEYQPATQE